MAPTVFERLQQSATARRKPTGLRTGPIEPIMTESVNTRLDIIEPVQNLFPSEKPASSPPSRNDKFIHSHPSAKGWIYIPPDFSFKHMNCCGVKEFHGLQNRHFLRNLGIRKVQTFLVTPEDVVARLQFYWAERWHERERPFIIFTDNHADYTRGEPFQGQRLTEFILEHNLGTVVRTGKHYNGNSGNEVECFTWVVNWPKVHAFKPKEQKNEQERSS